MRCDQGDKAVDHHTINNIQLPGDEYPGPYGHSGYEVTDSVDDLMAGHYHLTTLNEYYHEWGIGRHLLGSQMYDYWRDTHGFTHEHWTDGDLLDASIPENKASFRDVVMAQYGPMTPSTFGVTMPVDQIDKVRAEQPPLSALIKEMEKAAQTSETNND